MKTTLFNSRTWFGLWTAYTAFWLGRDVAKGDNPTFWIVFLVVWVGLAAFTDATGDK